ncbi:MAG: lysostaphin resistance A-like protein [Paracoccaceae bacterium]
MFPSLGVLVVWLAITIGGALAYHPRGMPLILVVTGQVLWSVAAAGLFLLLVIRLTGWPDPGLGKRPSFSAMRLAWLPLLLLSLVWAATVAIGMPPAPVLALLAINCLMIGLSEELMFRGILLQGLAARGRLWTAIILSAAIFGACHALNALATQDIAMALLQSVAAFLVGFPLVALRLRSGSLWPPVLLHGLWDFTLLSLGHTAVTSGRVPPRESVSPVDGWPVLMVLAVMATHSAWLMRRIPNTGPPLPEGPLGG